MPKLRNYYSWISVGLDASISDSRILLIWNLIYILGLQFHVAVDNDRDIISIDWISECINSKMLLSISPRLIISTRRKSRQTNILIVYPFLNAFPLSVYRHYLFQSRTTKEKLNMDIDAYGLKMLLKMICCRFQLLTALAKSLVGSWHSYAWNFCAYLQLFLDQISEEYLQVLTFSKLICLA